MCWVSSYVHFSESRTRGHKFLYAFWVAELQTMEGNMPCLTLILYCCYIWTTSVYFANPYRHYTYGYYFKLLYLRTQSHFFVETTHLGGHIYNLSNNPSTVRHGVLVCLINSIIINIKDVECSMKLPMQTEIVVYSVILIIPFLGTMTNRCYAVLILHVCTASEGEK